MSSPMQKTVGSRSISSKMPWRIASRYVTGAILSYSAAIDDCIRKSPLFRLSWLRWRFLDWSFRCRLFRRWRRRPDVAAVNGRRAKALQLRVPCPDKIAREGDLVVGQHLLFKDAKNRRRIGSGLQKVERRGLGLLQIVGLGGRPIGQRDFAAFGGIEHHFHAVMQQL